MKRPTTPPVEYSGRGDPETTLNILWGAGSEPRRGPKPGLSAGAVGRAALDIADADGLTALSMRALGARLGVSAMAIYRYVPNKEVLLELLLEAAYAQLPDDLHAGSQWQARLRRVARDAWNLYQAHPWMLQVSVQRPSLGPHAIRKYERELKSVASIGLSDLDMDLVVSAVSDYVRGSAKSAIEAKGAATATGQSDLEWWSAHSAHLARQVRTEQFPLAVRIGAAAGAAYGGPTDSTRSFEFGLERLISGIALYVNDKTTSGPHRRSD